MIKSTRKSKVVKVAAAAAALGSLAAIGFAGSSPAQADPAQWKEVLRGFGSDTTQDVFNAFQGQGTDGRFYTPLETTAPVAKSQGGSVLVSWDAFENLATAGFECIVPQNGAATVIRPNGSTNGHRMISASADPTIQWPITTTTTCDGNKFVQNMADFARSSSGPASGFGNTTGPLAWIPFGRDRLTIAYLRPTGSPVTNLTTTTITNAHATGVQLVDPDGTGPLSDVPVIACGIQTGSGTYGSWMSALQLANAVSGAGDNLGTNLCNLVGTGSAAGRVQENNGPDLTAKGALLNLMLDEKCDGVANGFPQGGVAGPVPCTNAQLIVGFSASQFIARSNGRGIPAPALGVNGGLGAIDGFYSADVVTNPDGIPAIVSPPIGLNGDETFTANTAAYTLSPSRFPRLVYNIVPVASFEGIFARPEIVEMFVGPTSKICTAAGIGAPTGQTIRDFGFLTLGTGCGNTVATRGNYRANVTTPDLR